MDATEARKPPVWAAWTLAGAAALALLGGGALALRTLEPKPEPRQDAVAVQEPAGAKSGRKKPEQFGLPSYPGAFDFRSTESDPKNGSAAFSIRKGTAADIARFYIAALGKQGGEFRGRGNTVLQPGTAANSPVLKGVRARWLTRDRHGELILLALDTPQKGRTAQAVLSWSPATPAARR
jgi:hypothetical protein